MEKAHVVFEDYRGIASHAIIGIFRKEEEAKAFLESSKKAMEEKLKDKDMEGPHFYMKSFQFQ